MSACSSAFLISTDTSDSRPSQMPSSSLRRYRRTVVLTWSLRLRPMWRRAPVAPHFSMRRDSMFMCTSSSDTFGVKSPLLISSAIPRRFSSIVSASFASRSPVCASILTCATLPRMSAKAMRQSRSSDWVKFMTASSVSCAKRPFHILASSPSKYQASSLICSIKLA